MLVPKRTHYILQDSHRREAIFGVAWSTVQSMFTSESLKREL